MKSKQCIAVDALLRKSKPLRNPADMLQELRKKRRQNARDYKLPYGVQLVIKPQVEVIEGVLCYKVGKGSLAVMYFHGGSYVDPPTPFHWRFWQQLCREADITIYVVMYGRTPQYHCFRTVTKQRKVYQQLLKRHGADNLVLMGDSAGGGLALALSEYLAVKHICQPSKLVLFSPWLDVDMTSDCSAQLSTDFALDLRQLKFWGACYRHNLPEGNFLACPINGVTSQLPPMHVFVGGAELFLADCIKLKHIADQVGAQVTLHIWEEMQHVFVMYPIPEAKAARKCVVEILNNKEQL